MTPNVHSLRAEDQPACLTTTSEGENESKLSFFPSAVGGSARRAFTLIELLVVIAIISLLSSIVLASLSSARASARDTRRVSDMRQILTAVELYRNQHGHIPGHGGGSCDYHHGSNTDDDSTRLADADNCIVNQLETVMTAVPTDPIGEDGFYYAYDTHHANTGNACDGETSAVLSFHKSETGINDRETTSGGDEGIGTTDVWNRMICLNSG